MCMIIYSYLKTIACKCNIKDLQNSNDKVTLNNITHKILQRTSGPILE